MISREMLEKEYAALETQKKTAINNAQAIDGAIQMCRYLLNKFDVPECPEISQDISVKVE
jgi:hypothetical protein